MIDTKSVVASLGSYSYLDLMLRLDLTENILVSKKAVRDLMLQVADSIDPRQYPDPAYSKLRQKIAKFLQISPNSIVVGAGSSQLIDALLRFSDRKGRLLIIEPCYTDYRLRGLVYGIPSKAILLDLNYNINIKDIITFRKKARCIVVVSPNCPLGKQFEAQMILQILDNFDGQVIIDEAFGEFGNYSTKDWCADYPNLVVLKTFSKAWGLAGLRIGYAVCNEHKVEKLRPQLPSWSISSFSAKVVELALENPKYMQEGVQKAVVERDFLSRKLRKIEGVTVIPSTTNFLMIRTPFNADFLQAQLKKKRILVHSLQAKPLCTDAIRVTVGKRELNKIFLNGLLEILHNAKKSKKCR